MAVLIWDQQDDQLRLAASPTTTPTALTSPRRTTPLDYRAAQGPGVCEVWRTLRDLLRGSGSVGVEDAGAQEVKSGAAEHLPLQHFDLVDGAFDRSRTMAQRQPRLDAARSNTTPTGRKRRFRCSTPGFGTIVCPSSAEARPAADAISRTARPANWSRGDFGGQDADTSATPGTIFRIRHPKDHQEPRSLVTPHTQTGHLAPEQNYAGALPGSRPPSAPNRDGSRLKAVQ